MQSFPPTFILRHRRENLKKCSLSGLEKREDMRFFSYPISVLPPLDQHILLVMEGAEELCVADADYGLLILDSTWRYLNKMVQFVEKDSVVVKRTLPSLFKTAYPRRQEDCVDPERGLSSIEALYVAYHLLGRDTTQLLDTYYWKDQFQQINSHLL
ncbi:Uncharacterized protein PHSC3_001418 [Chlamydiales bacterium STE3]|nr:Uncharacterized protein PHSC3_001418 [Chlamydiales bacterium STE3]